jgi:hypothetical protein
MPLDPELLKKAQGAAAQLAEAERQVLLARAEYHTVIRRLHLGGASLREIAQALGLSHQRVQQIVKVAGGSWWQRMWRTRRVRRDAVCTFCGRPPSEVSKLIAGPDVYICDACVGLAEQVRDEPPRSSDGLALAKPGSKQECSFCGKRRSDKRPLLTGTAANVCKECLRLCREILEDRSA